MELKNYNNVHIMTSVVLLLLGALLDVLYEPGLLVLSVGLLGVDDDLAHSRQTQGGHCPSYTLHLYPHWPILRDDYRISRQNQSSPLIKHKFQGTIWDNLLVFDQQQCNMAEARVTMPMVARDVREKAVNMAGT